ncbi:MAG: polysaccharide pyruvyl transferase CsaB [Candidatus Bipolaricaulia bacterium]
MESTNRIIISGYYGYGNLGDEGILKSLISSLKDRLGAEGLEIVVLSNDPKRTREDHGVESVNRWNPVKVLLNLKNSDILISGGGGLLQDRTSSFSLWYYLALIYVARILSVPIYVLGQGLGPINRKYNELLLRGAVSGVEGFLVRDKRSEELLHSFGVGNDKVIAGNDLAFLLQSDNNRASYLNSQNKEIVAAALRSDIKGRSDVLRAVSSGLDMLHDEFDANVVLFSTNYLSDAAMNSDLQSATEVPCKIIDVDHLSPNQLVEMMQGLDLVIAGRLHALIFSLLSNTPVQGISYDPKMDYLIEDLNDLDCSPDISIWHPDELIKATEYLSDLESIYRDKEELKETVSRAKQVITSRTKEKLDLALDWIEEELEREQRR